MLVLSGGCGGRHLDEIGPKGFAAMQQNGSRAMPAMQGLPKEKTEKSVE
jgi:hypothetical protein